MTFQEAVATESALLRLWMLWLVIALTVTPLILLLFRQSRREGLIVLGVALGTIVFMQWLYDQVGYVRLLGLPHVLLWTPLALYLWLRQGELGGVPRAIVLVFLVTISISLVFDYIDVARWFLGERSSMAG